jgi:hypothetical protein
MQVGPVPSREQEAPVPDPFQCVGAIVPSLDVVALD